MKRRKSVRKCSSYDVHHILWTRRSWEKGIAKELRNHWYCQIKLEREGMHRWIHEEVCKIPVPESPLIEDCLKQLAMLEKAKAIHESDPIDVRLNVLICCLDTGESPTAEALKAQLNAVRNYKPR